MNPALINWFNLAKEIDFIDTPVEGKQAQVLTKTLDLRKLSIEDLTEISEEEYKSLEKFFEASDEERIDMLQTEYLRVPCEKVTILHSYCPPAGFMSFTLNSPTYHQIMEALMSVSTCGFDGDVLVHGDHLHGYIEI